MICTIFEGTNKQCQIRKRLCVIPEGTDVFCLFNLVDCCFLNKDDWLTVHCGTLAIAVRVTSIRCLLSMTCFNLPPTLKMFSGTTYITTTASLWWHNSGHPYESLWNRRVCGTHKCTDTDSWYSQRTYLVTSMSRWRRVTCHCYFSFLTNQIMNSNLISKD